MVRSKAIVVGGLVGLVIGVSLYVIDKIVKAKPPPEGLEYTLILEATVGGTTEPLPGTYYSDTPTTVTVRAIPDAGYIFEGWYLSGELVSTELVYNVYVDGNILLIASFYKEDEPPLIPAYIRPVQSCVTEDWWYAHRKQEINGSYLLLDRLKQISGYVKFKISDAAGNGVRGQQIAVYTDPNPDELDFGYVYLNDAEHTSTNPLILTSDANGVVSVKITYKWIEPASDYKYSIGIGAKATYAIAGINIGTIYPIYNNAFVSIPAYWAFIERVKHPILSNINVVHAHWVDNPNLPVYGDATALCMIKIDKDLHK